MHKVIALINGFTLAAFNADIPVYKRIWDKAIQPFWGNYAHAPHFLITAEQIEADHFSDKLAAFSTDDNCARFNMPYIFSTFRPNPEAAAGLMAALEAHELGHFQLLPATLSRHKEGMLRAQSVLPREKWNHAATVVNLLGDFCIDTHIGRKELTDPHWQGRIPFIALRKQLVAINGFKTAWPVLQARLYETLWSEGAGQPIELLPHPRYLEAVYQGEIPLTRIDQDVRILKAVIRDILQGNDWLQYVKVVTRLLEPYLDKLALNCSPDQKPLSGEDLDEKTVRDILSHHGDDMQPPMSITEFTSLVEPVTQSITRARQLYFHNEAMRQVFAPIRLPDRETGPMVPIYHRKMNGKDPLHTFKPERMTDSGFFKPVRGFNMERQIVCEGQGRSRKFNYPDLVLYMDQSGSMPNPMTAESEMTLAGLVFSYTAIAFGQQVKLRCYSDNPDEVNGRMKSQVLWGTSDFTRNKTELLAQFVRAPGPGKDTRFPIRQFLSDLKIAADSGKAHHFCVVSDQEIRFLLNIQADWLPLFRKNPRLFLDIIYNPATGYNPPTPEQIRTVTALPNVAWHSMAKGWDGLSASIKHRADEIYRREERP